MISYCLIGVFTSKGFGAFVPRDLLQVRMELKCIWAFGGCHSFL